MAGNPDVPDFSESNPEPFKATPPEKPVRPRIKTFSCPACGAPVTVHYAGFSMSAVCESCRSVIDTTDENYNILCRHFAKKALWNPIIPLGTRGKLDGKLWETIGFMVRSDITGRYTWDEYLLFNPYYGYRWLVQDHGHWNFVQTIKQKPFEINQARSTIYGASAEYNGKKYKLFNRGTAKVNFVLGEFYWRVIVDSRVEATDYIAPPHMLSKEKDESEVIWSLATYIDAKEVEKAFKLQSKMPFSSGVGANQPSKLAEDWNRTKMLWGIFLGVLTCAQIFFFGTALNRQETTFSGTYPPNGKTTDITTPVFNLDKALANVRVDIQAPGVNNSWFWVAGELVNDTDGTTIPFEKSVEYYYGTDSDGSWSEGGTGASVQISSVPGGQYYLNLDSENGDAKSTDPMNYTVNVFRDVPTMANYWWCLFFVSIMPMISFFSMRQEEVARWSNSDFSPYSTGE